MSQQPGQWNDAAIAHLRRMHAAGLTFLAIHRELAEIGIKVSRNAVIGKARRIGLESRAGLNNAKAHIREPKPRKRRDKTVREPPRRPAVHRAKRQHVVLTELAPDGCRFPFGNFPFLFCNDPQQDAVSYCARHYRLTHDRSRPRG